MAQATHGLADHAEARPVLVGAGLAIAGDAQHDEPGIQRRQGLVIESPAFEGAGAKVLDQDIGLPDQAAHDILAL